MAKSDPVKVTVDIIDKFTKDLEKLEKKLDKIDGKRLKVELDIDDNGSIEKTKKQLKELEKSLESVLTLKTRGFEKALAEKKALAKNETATISYRTRGGRRGFAPSVQADGGGVPRVSPSVIRNIQGFEGSSASIGQMNRAITEMVDDYLAEAVHPWHPGSFPGLHSKDYHLKSEAERDFLGGIGDTTSRSRSLEGRGPQVPLGPMRDRPGMSGMGLWRQTRMAQLRNYPKNLRRNVSRSVGSRMPDIGAMLPSMGDISSGNRKFEKNLGSGTFTKIGKTLAKYKPNIMMWWQLLALILPMIITLLGAVLGVVAAFAALAVAGAAVIGIGLLGYGDDLTESFDNFKEKLKEVGSELFDVLQPTAARFQPILDSGLDALARHVGEITSSLNRLTEFESFLGRSGAGMIDWVGRGIDAMADMSAMIEQVGLRFGRITGDLIINVLQWATRELYNNQEAFLRLGGILTSVIVIIYNLSKAVSFALIVFEPLFRIIAEITRHLSNPFILALTSAIAIILAMQGALFGVNMMLKVMGLTMFQIAGSGIKALVVGMYSLISSALAAIGVIGVLNAMLATLLTLTGLGIAVVAASTVVGEAVGGPPDDDDFRSGTGNGSRFGGPGAAGATINIYGDVRNREYQKLKDEFPNLYENERNIDEETTR